MNKAELSEEETLVYSKENGGTIRFQLVEGTLVVKIRDVEVKVLPEQWGFSIETESEIA